ncbi:MAG: peptidoglycan editing factor PgeF [Rhabdochlamydiaceae bacterium]
MEFEQLQAFPQVKHGVFLKQGELMLYDRKGDVDQLHANCEGVRKIIGCDRLIKARACHGADVLEVSSSNSKLDKLHDGLITQDLHLGLLIDHADCQAAIFYDPLKGAIGNVHSGWKGNVQNIYKNAIKAMKDTFGTDPADLLVCISPSLGPCCGEFKNYQTELPESFWRHQESPTYFNLWEISRGQLLEYGVLAAHIEIAGICTMCQPDDFYSYRRDKTTCRNGTVVALQM